MICNYESCRCESGTKNCGCMKGIMTLVGIIAGIVFTAAVVLLFINSFIDTANNIVWAELITALVYLFAVLAIGVISRNGNADKCIRCNSASLFTGIFGTIFSGLLAIGTTFAADDVFSAVILGLTSFFFAYMIISVLYLIKCTTDVS